MKIVADRAIPFLEGVFEPYAEVVYKDGRAIVREDLLDADALVTRTRTRCDAALLEGTRVSLIATATIGTDHIDLPWCAAHGIRVCNAAGCNAGGVMDYVFSALYAVAARKAIPLAGKTFGVVGVGHVGSKVEEMAEKLHFNVLRCDPPRAEAEGPEGFVSLEELLDRSDIVTLHTPLNATTRGMADDDFFSRMRTGAIFINASRGEVVNESALLHAIPKLGAVIIDTWCNEPRVNRILMDAVDIATPHIAGYSFQGKQNGTAAVVHAVAKKFGIDALRHFFPAAPVPELEPITLDVTGMSQGQIAATFQYNYPVLTDDFLFRMQPDGFEAMRTAYQYRREFNIITTMTNKDLQQIAGRGVSPAAIQQQIECFRRGFPWMKIVSPATPERGIRVLTEAEADAAVAYAETAEVAGKCKFVPASGAASRMFKDIFAGLAKLDAGEDLPADAPGARLAASVKKFAFYTEALFGTPEDSAAYRKDVLEKVLTDKGLGYGNKPKGVIRFHRYPEEVRTAIAEHLVEAQAYMRNADGSCNLVVTISPEHRSLFEEALAEVQPAYEARYGVKYHVTFTYQDKATDTIAVDGRNQPFRTDEGTLLFRPAGHGALIHNLNAVDAELVSIKNIDNVAHEKYLPETARFKKVLMGEALRLRDRIFDFLRRFDAVAADPCSAEARCLCNEAEAFLDKELCVQLPLAHGQAERFEMIRAKLDRPVRVCGMVRNEGEPGGGPFVIAGKDGATSLQILESVQVNKDDKGAADALARATHFNPVDLVCCLRDYKGRKFDLLRHVDPDAGFISSKSYQGRELKALELPGLWNGAMSDWNTLFVEVPLATFNPVKVVLDLLRPAHQG